MKHSTRLTAFLLSLVLLAGALTAATDPVVSRSYLTETYQPYIFSKTQEALSTAFGALEQTLLTAFSRDGIRARIGAGLWERRMNGGAKALPDGSWTVAAGSVVSGPVGTQITLVSGAAQVIAAPAGTLLNLSTGIDCPSGTVLSPGNLCLIADTSGAGVKITADAVVSVKGGAVLLSKTPAAAVSPGVTGTTTPTNPQNPGSYTEQYLKYAQALQEMGLFRGTNNGFELTRAANRIEALVMLIRLLGEEEAALASTAKHPFKDVPSWADRYVAYGYANGYTNGVSKTAFGSSQTVTVEQYLTFLLRSLGYSDASGDFVWSKASEKAIGIGMITQSEFAAISPVFYRDQVAFTSYKALLTARKGETVRLLDILIDAGVVSLDAAYSATVIVG